MTVPRPTRPLGIVAHRGASAAAPENTVPAIARAAAMGVRWVELDVALLGDGTAVLHHDATLDRCTDRSGPLRSIGVQDLAGIDAGGWFDPAFAGERIPTLEIALDTVGTLDLAVNLELKPHGADPAPLAAAAVAALAARPALAGRVTVSSFDHAALATLRALATHLPVAPIYTRPSDWRAKAQTLGAEAIHARARDLDPAAVAEIAAAGLAVRCFTVNDPTAVAGLVEAGLDALFTDVPDRFLADPTWRAWDGARA
ncbi:MAG: glycerophosphodiester phosphodiesterase family protein [Pseudomonadota bacterium]